ncbi:MAG: TonB-dependent siderophore receptor [Moraxellaceae bacterium]|nr:TonB-dependent siderophore receptor [Moraxellaceae bacterium]
MSISRNQASLPARRPLVLAVAMASFGMMTTSLQAAEATQTMLVLPQINVIGTSEEDVYKQPGAATIVTAAQLEMIQARSTEEALRAVPGVYIKPEEESAVVANIGIRGLSANDNKTLILEDGVPVAASLFLGNGRYYNPRIQRMESIEVLKGASSLRYGPSTIGGVINYRTKQPKDGLAVETSVGSWNTIKGTIEVGGTSKSGDAVVGAVLSTAHSDGFMDKGYKMNDAMVKAGMALGDNQWLGVKFTHYENDANISYRGLFLNDFKAGRQYNPAPDDYFETERKSFDINHQWDINDDVKLNTLLYWSQMNRDYWRFAVNSAASTAAGRWVYTDAVQGNNRAFERHGIETRAQIRNSLFGVTGEAEVGLRYMKEEMKDQTVNATRATPRSGTINGDQVHSAESYALFLQNRFDMTDRLAITPGVRVERYTQERENLLDANPAGKTSNTEVIPGISATFQVVPALQVFGSVHKAFAPAQTAQSIVAVGGVFQDQQLDAERSTNFELGARGKSGALSYEVAAFHMDFKNQIVPANSTIFTNDNAGKTIHQGLEGAVAYQFDGGFSADASVTWIPVADVEGDRTNAAGTVITARDGNRVPYVPELVANLGLGYQVGSLKTRLSLNHTSSQYTDLLNTPNITEQNNNNLWVGKVEAYTTADLTARYSVNKRLDVFGSVKNLTDELYVASLRQGIYVGPERSYEVGLRYEF